MTTTEQPGANSLPDMLHDYFRRMDVINDGLDDTQKIAREDKTQLGVEFASKTGVKKKFLTKKYNEHRSALKAEKKRAEASPSDILTLEQLEEAIEGFKGTPLYDAAKEAFKK
jgi:hypothetical protein